MTSLHHFLCAVKHALHGIGFTFWSERNMAIHGVAAIVAISCGWAFHISLLEWGLLISAVALVMVSELINTSIEILVDLVTKKRKYRAMLSKDIAAGAVLLSALYALAIAGVIFCPKLFNLVTEGS